MRRLVLWVVATVALFGVLLSPTAASAHAVLDSSTPASSSVLESPPTEIRLDFSETIESSLLSIQLFNSEKQNVPIGAAERLQGDDSIAVSSVPTLDNGVYVVVWRAVSADGHPLSGAFPFEIGNSATVDANELLTQVLKGLETDSPLGTPLAVSRFLAYVAVVALIGMLSFVWGAPHFSTPSVVGTLRRAVLMFAVGSLGILMMQGPYAASRGWGAVLDGSLLADVIPTRVGIASLARLVLTIAWAVLVISLSRAPQLAWRVTFVATSALSAATFAVSGHASAASLPGVFATVDGVHLVAVSVWVGAFLASVLVRSEEGVVRLSRLATVAMPIAIISGVVQAMHLTGGISNITDSRYGSYLIVKVAVVLTCLAIGFRLRLRMKKGESTVGQSLFLEAGLLVAVIAITAGMVGSSPTATASSATSFSATQIQSDIVADFSILPTRIGAAEVHVYLTPPGGAIAPVDNVEMSFTLPSQDIPAIPVDLIEISPNHWSGVMQFPYAGDWSMEARVQPKPTDTLLYTATVPIND